MRQDGPNDETNWRRRLAGEKVETYDGEPDYGFYRTSNGKGGPVLPIAYWYTPKGDLRWKFGREDAVVELKENDAKDRWKFASVHAITHEEYLRVYNGGEWSDIDTVVAEQLDNQRARIGNNKPPEDPAEELKLEIENAEAAVHGYKTINDEDTAKKAQSLRSRLLELAGKADKTHDKLKAPYWEECKKIDAKWLPLVRLASGAADTIRAALKAFENRKLQEQRRKEELQRQADQEAARVAAAEAAKNAPKRKPMHEAPLVPANQPAPLPPPPAPIKGAYGRAASVSVKKIARIQNWDAVYGAFKERDEVKTLLQRLAQRAVDDGHQVDGVAVEEEADVR